MATKLVDRILFNTLLHICIVDICTHMSNLKFLSQVFKGFTSIMW